jgi:cation diffusion facilitator CzcD-associated flavoprotein CzcO
MDHGSTDTLIIGAGPYGLSLSAHLHAAGVEHRVLGDPLGSWRGMPAGMKLRSAVSASSLSDAAGALSIDAFHAERGERLVAPVALEKFLEYTDWFIERAGIDVDRRLVSSLSHDGEGLVAQLDDGEPLRARRVVLAAGVKPFRWVPPELDGLPESVASHSGDHASLAKFAGRRVVVIGGGQSAIECAALAHEAGASVSVLMRAPAVNWLTRSARLHSSVLGSVLYSPTDVGPAGLSRLVSLPDLFRLLPPATRVALTRRCIRPAAAAWLVERTAEVQIDAGRSVRAVRAVGDGVVIDCNGGESIEADHVLMATGYRVDLARYAFLAPELLASIKAVDGLPVLGSGFASSVPGLRIIGAPASYSYGPMMRFISGAAATARTVTRSLASGAGASARAAHEPPAARYPSRAESLRN